MTGSSSVSIVVPAFNERRTIRSLLDEVLSLALDVDFEVVVVDDGSTDGTGDIARAAGDDRVIVVSHSVNRGKGAAIQSALDHVTGDMVVVLDADREYAVDELRSVVGPLLDGRADAVFGSRFAAGAERRVMFYWHELGNRLITWFVNVTCDLNLTDVMSGYKAIRTDLLRSLRLSSARFTIEAELAIRLSQWGATIYEVPVSYHGRSYSEGKKTSWRDGLSALVAVIQFGVLDRSFTKRGGHDSLASLAAADRLNRWIIEEMGGQIGGRVLEAGCGTGNILSLLLDAPSVLAVDVDPFYVESVRRRFGRLDNVAIECVDVASDDFLGVAGSNCFDSVVSVNVLEHIEDDVSAIKNLHAAMVPGGSISVLVPAHPDLFSAADSEMGHYRRYEPDELRSKLEAAGFEDVAVRPFNRLGEIGWRLNKAMGRAEISAWQARAYSLVVPIARGIDRMGIGRGLSVIGTARKSLGPS